MHLNLGSGQRRFGDGWINIDSQAKWLPDVVSDGIVYLRSYAEGTVDMIVLHHVLEHYGCGEADELLGECARVLRPGGSLLVFVPDIWELASGWMEGKISTQIYLTNVYGAFMGDEADRHRWAFTQRSLNELLMSKGFPVPYRFDWREIPGADIARDWWILGVEAVK